ncbi:hypothetical protein GUJ93_ZPchr0005g14454 [Zizania palustris]|uniref:Uncharacterized protein n=1 Tax=Zizania palustris TaxID=103762 RepID=A0A8J5T8W1_ZIZPA|nr:hypothetical protein GUJ93_ZPchr0005g14454 [Zizania palustris]
MRLAPQQSWKHEAVASPPWEEMTRDETKNQNRDKGAHICAAVVAMVEASSREPEGGGRYMGGAEGFGWGGGGGSRRRRRLWRRRRRHRCVGGEHGRRGEGSRSGKEEEVESSKVEGLFC